MKSNVKGMHNNMLVNNLINARSDKARHKLNKFILRNPQLVNKIDLLTENLNSYVKGIKQPLFLKDSKVDKIENIISTEKNEDGKTTPTLEFIDIYLCKHYQCDKDNYILSDKTYLFENNYNISLSKETDVIVDTALGYQRACVVCHITIPVTQAKGLFEYYGGNFNKRKCIIGLFNYSLSKKFSTKMMLREYAKREL